MEKVASIFTTMLIIAGVTVVVSSRNSAPILTAGGNAWIGSVRAIMGK